MSDSNTWVGMGVHQEYIFIISFSRDSGAVIYRWETPNTTEGMERLAACITGLVRIRCGYEAGPCGYNLRRFPDGKGNLLTDRRDKEMPI